MNQTGTPGQRLRTARAWADLTQPELARRLGISLAMLKRIEADTRDASDAQLRHAGQACGVPDWFMLQGWREEQSRRRSMRRRGDMTFLAELEHLRAQVRGLEQRLQEDEVVVRERVERVEQLVGVS